MTRVAAAGVVLLLSVTSVMRAADALQISRAARSIRQGEVVLFTAKAGMPIEALRARAFGRDIPTFRVDSETWQAVVGIDLGVRPGSHVVSFDARVDGHDTRTTHTLAVGKSTFPTRTVHVDDQFVNPSAAAMERIAAEAKELGSVWEQSAQTRLWNGAFVRPVPGEATSSFGKRSIFNGEPRQPHGGADFLSPSGTPIHAPNSGRIVIARDLYLTGNTVVIDHGLGVFSLLAHLSDMDVHAGDRVTAGQIVGHVGATGRVSGPHLHWAVRINGARVDPLAVLAILGTTQ